LAGPATMMLLLLLQSFVKTLLERGCCDKIVFYCLSNTRTLSVDHSVAFTSQVPVLMFYFVVFSGNLSVGTMPLSGIGSISRK
jgi:hypothetical protein